MQEIEFLIKIGSYKNLVSLPFHFNFFSLSTRAYYSSQLEININFEFPLDVDFFMREKLCRNTKKRSSELFPFKMYLFFLLCCEILNSSSKRSEGVKIWINSKMCESILWHMNERGNQSEHSSIQNFCARN